MDDTTCPSNGVVRVIVPIYNLPDRVGFDIYGGPVPGGGYVDFTHNTRFIPGIARENYLQTDAELLSTQEFETPPDGANFLFDYIKFPGTQLILHGKRPNYAFFLDEFSPYTQRKVRGFSLRMAFNDNAPVHPGEIGLLTWDLPTWVAIGGTVDASGDPPTPFFEPDIMLGDFGRIVTVFNDWTAVCVSSPAVLIEQTGCLYTLASDVISKRSYIGAGVLYTIVDEIE